MRNKQQTNTSEQAEAAARRACIELVKEHMRREGMDSDPSDKAAIDFAIAAVAAALSNGGIVCDGESFRKAVIGHTAKLLQEVTGRETAIDPTGAILFVDEHPEIAVHVPRLN